MRALRERPRVTVAKFLAIGLVFLLGVAFAGALSNNGPDVPPETARALERAQSAADTRADRLRAGSADVERLEREVKRLGRRLEASGGRNTRLRRALARARRQIRELQP